MTASTRAVRRKGGGLRSRKRPPRPGAYERPRPTWRVGHYDGPTEHRERHVEARFMATGIVPPIYQRNPGACLSLLYKAQALDVPVATAVENIHWNTRIGKGSLSAQLMAGLLRRHGYDYKVTHEDNERVTMVFYRLVVGRRRRLGEVTWTILEAIGAGLAWRDLWQHYPTDMLWARCLMRGARRHASEVGTGMAYTLEELHDMVAPDEGTAPSDAVQALLDEATSESATPELIKGDIVPRATKAGLLAADLGDGTTLGQALGIIWGEKRAAQVDQLQAEALAAAEANPPSPPAGAGPLSCGCPSDQVLAAAGTHIAGVCREL